MAFHVVTSYISKYLYSQIKFVWINYSTSIFTEHTFSGIVFHLLSKDWKFHATELLIIVSFTLSVKRKIKVKRLIHVKLSFNLTMLYWMPFVFTDWIYRKLIWSMGNLQAHCHIQYNASIHIIRLYTVLKNWFKHCQIWMRLVYHWKLSKSCWMHFLQVSIPTCFFRPRWNKISNVQGKHLS